MGWGNCGVGVSRKSRSQYSRILWLGCYHISIMGQTNRLISRSTFSVANSPLIVVPFVYSAVCTITPHVDAVVCIHRLGRTMVYLHTSQLDFACTAGPTVHHFERTESYGTDTASSQDERNREKCPCHRYVCGAFGIASSMHHADANLGASRGISLQFVRTLVEQQYTVWATVRPQSITAPAAEIVRHRCAQYVARD
jgi:hypothetical protein